METAKMLQELQDLFQARGQKIVLGSGVLGSGVNKIRMIHGLFLQHRQLPRSLLTKRPMAIYVTGVYFMLQGERKKAIQHYQQAGEKGIVQAWWSLARLFTNICDEKSAELARVKGIEMGCVRCMVWTLILQTKSIPMPGEPTHPLLLRALRVDRNLTVRCLQQWCECNKLPELSLEWSLHE
jgi:hypothetical protein